MKAVKSIERLIRELHLSSEGGSPLHGQRSQLWSSHSRSDDSTKDSPKRPHILALPSTMRAFPKQSNPKGYNNVGLLREELEKVSKQLAEQRALVATLEVEITIVLQEKKIQELDYKSHVQQLENKVAYLKQRLQNYYKEDNNSAICEDMLHLLQELFSHDINAGQPLYKELLAIPINRKKAKDDVLLLIYEKILSSHENYEKCWNGRESLRCTLAQANEEIQRLDRDLKQAYKISECEKQEMLQEVERLTSQWRDLSMVAAKEKQELIKQVQKLNDELKEVTSVSIVEKQEIKEEVEQITHKLRCSQDIAHKDRKSMRIEIQRLANEIQQSLSTAASEKQLLNEEVQLLNNKLRVTLETTTNEKQKFNAEIARLIKEFQQQSSSTNLEKKNLSDEVIKLKDELCELSTSSSAEKQEMTNKLHTLTCKVKHLFSTSVGEKQAMQLKLNIANTRNDRLANEYQHALLQLESLTNECTTDNIQLKEKMDGVEMAVSDMSLCTKLTDANIHELMDETRQLLGRIEFKDHPMPFHDKVKLIMPNTGQDKQIQIEQILLQTPKEIISMYNPMDTHNEELLQEEHHLQIRIAKDLETTKERSEKNTNVEIIV